MTSRFTFPRTRRPTRGDRPVARSLNPRKSQRHDRLKSRKLTPGDIVGQITAAKAEFAVRRPLIPLTTPASLGSVYTFASRLLLPDFDTALDAPPILQAQKPARRPELRTTSEETLARNLVTIVATRLMETTASTVADVNEQVLAELVQHLDIDAAFLRHNDHKIRVSRLVAAWPPRREDAGPDPRRSHTSAAPTRSWRCASTERTWS